MSATVRSQKRWGTPQDQSRFGVLLVDNHDLVHIGLRVVLQRQPWVTRVLGARRGADALLIASRHEPAVALVDLFVGGEWGTQICADMRARSPQVRVLLMSSCGSLTQQAAHAAGASGFVAKDAPLPQMLAAIRAAADRAQPFVWRPEVARGRLTARQQQILQLMAQGATNRAIAESLGLSVDTIKHHTTLIYRRLGVRNRAGAVNLGQRLGLLADADAPWALVSGTDGADRDDGAWPPLEIAA
jgi:two-component system response regulator DesR